MENLHNNKSHLIFEIFMLSIGAKGNYADGLPLLFYVSVACYDMLHNVNQKARMSTTGSMVYLIFSHMFI
jgi:hypothetical protein